MSDSFATPWTIVHQASFSVHGISQAKIPEWVAISFSKGLSLPRDQTHVSCTGRQILCCGTTRQALCLLIFALVVLAFSVKLKEKKSLSRPTSVSLPSMLSSKNFMVSGFESDLMLWPYIQVLNPFRVYICVWCKIGVQFHYFACLSGTIFWKDCPSPLSILHSFVV